MRKLLRNCALRAAWRRGKDGVQTVCRAGAAASLPVSDDPWAGAGGLLVGALAAALVAGEALLFERLVTHLRRAEAAQGARRAEQALHRFAGLGMLRQGRLGHLLEHLEDFPFAAVGFDHLIDVQRHGALSSLRWGLLHYSSNGGGVSRPAGRLIALRMR